MKLDIKALGSMLGPIALYVLERLVSDKVQETMIKNMVKEEVETQLKEE